MASDQRKNGLYRLPLDSTRHIRFKSGSDVEHKVDTDTGVELKQKAINAINIESKEDQSMDEMRAEYKMWKAFWSPCM